MGSASLGFEPCLALRVGEPVRRTSATTRFKGNKSGARSWQNQSRRETSGCRHRGVGWLSEQPSHAVMNQICMYVRGPVESALHFINRGKTPDATPLTAANIGRPTTSVLKIRGPANLAGAWSAQPAPASPRPPRAAHVEVF